MAKIPPEAFARVSGTIPPPPPVSDGMTDEQIRSMALVQAVRVAEGRLYTDVTRSVLSMAAGFERYLKGD